MPEDSNKDTILKINFNVAVNLWCSEEVNKIKSGDMLWERVDPRTDEDDNPALLNSSEEVNPRGFYHVGDDEEGNENIYFDIGKLLKETGDLINKHHSAAQAKEFVEQAKEFVEQYEKKQKEGDNSDTQKAETIAWLYSRWSILKKIDAVDVKLKEAEKQQKAIKNAKDPKKAHEIDLKRSKDDPYFNSPVSAIQEAEVDEEVRSYQSYLNTAKKGLDNIISHGAIDKKDYDAIEKGVVNNRIYLAADLTKAAVKEALNPFLKGVIDFANSNPADDERLKKFKESVGRMLRKSPFSDPKFNRIRGQIESLHNERDSGILSEAEFNALSEEFIKQAETEDKKQKEYLEKLQAAIQEANKAIIGKIEKDTQEGDDLNKYRILQLLLLVSPFFPLPIVGVLFNVLQPFLSGALNIPDFLASFLSVDGPLGDAAWLFDKMELDDLVKWLGHLADGPLDVVNELLVNDVTAPIYNSFGQGLVNSPLSSWALAAVVEVVTGHSGREINRMKAAENVLFNPKENDTAKMQFGQDILSDAKEKMKRAFKDIEDPRKEELEKQARDFVRNNYKVKENVFIANKAASWLIKHHKTHPESCKMLIENLFGDKAKELIGVLNDDQKLTTALSKLNSKEGFKSLLNLMGAKKENVDPLFQKENELAKKGELEKARLAAEKEKENLEKTTATPADEEGRKKLKEAKLAANKKLDIIKLEEVHLNHENEIIKSQQNEILKTAISGINYKDIEENFKNEFAFYEAEKLNLEHKYIPKLGAQLNRPKLLEKLRTNISNENHWICGKEIIDKINEIEQNNKEFDLNPYLTPKIIDRMILAEFVFTSPLKLNLTKDDLVAIKSLSELDPNPNYFNLSNFLVDKGMDVEKQKEIVSNIKAMRQNQLIVEEYLEKNHGPQAELVKKQLNNQNLNYDELSYDIANVDKWSAAVEIIAQDPHMKNFEMEELVLLPGKIREMAAKEFEASKNLKPKESPKEIESADKKYREEFGLTPKESGTVTEMEGSVTEAKAKEGGAALKFKKSPSPRSPSPSPKAIGSSGMSYSILSGAASLVAGIARLAMGA